MAPPRNPEEGLGESLQRIERALASKLSVAPTEETTPSARARTRRTTNALLAASGAFVALAIVTGQFALLVPAVIFAIAGGIMLAARLGGALQSMKPYAQRPGEHDRAHVGMGASVAEDARLEPGSVVEMGATVGAGAVIESGAVVQMGATVEAGAIVRSGAVVGWGATVRAGGVVGRNGYVGWGATIERGAELAEGASISAGGTLHATKGSPTRTETPRATPVSDPRAARVDEVCDRLEAGFRDSSAEVRQFLGGSADTVKALRRTCHDLLARERALRKEADPQAISRLDEDRRTLEARIASAGDEQVRKSLEGAISAIDEQKRQRALLGRHADRLDAEHTRLVYTLESMASQLVRMRAAGTEVSAGTSAELEQSVVQLRGEIDAIADALEQVTRESGAAVPDAIAANPPENREDSGPGARGRVRE